MVIGAGPMSHSGGADSAHGGFETYFQRTAAQIETNFTTAANHASVDAIHDFRVCLKRLRALVNLVERVNPVFSSKRTFKPFRRIFKAAGGVRDLQVQEELVRRWTGQLHLELSEYYNFLKECESVARARFYKKAGDFNLSLLERCRKGVADALATETSETVLIRTRRHLEHSISRLVTYHESANLEADDYHQIRILTKESRYVVEILQLCFPEREDLGRLNEAMREVHRALGAWHDDDVALERIQDFLENCAHRPLFDDISYDELQKGLQVERDGWMKRFGGSWSELLTVIDGPELTGKV